MYGFPSDEIVKRLKEEYPQGTRVALVNMDDPYSKLQPGDRGTVKGVDDAGTVHVAWDCGSGLGIAYGEDSCRKLTEKELAEEQAATEEVEEAPQKINVLICEPLTAPYMKEIDSSLESLQATVGGLIQAIYPFEDQVALVCNEEGKINGLTLNRAVYGSNGEMLDIIAGTFFITGLTEDSFGSLSPELAEKYSKLLYNPEIFVREGDEIKAIPVKPSVRKKLQTNTAEIKKESQDKVHNKSEHEI